MAETPYTSLVSRYFEDLMNAGHLAVADEVLAPDLAFHGTQTIHGVEPFKQFVTMVRTAFPDIHFTVEDTFGEGDKAVARFTLRGTHRQEFQGIAATNKPVEILGVDIFYIREGRIAEVWLTFDRLSLMQQLGVLP
jgi:steroid delta-isomerase-like uncharacterized protein